MKGKKTLREKFQKAGKEMIEFGSDNYRLPTYGIIGILVFAFNRHAALTIAAMPAVACGVGAILEKISRIGEKDPHP